MYEITQEEIDEALRRRRGRPKGGQGTVNREIVYKCSVCDHVRPRDELIVKRAVFLEMGRNAKQLKSRVVAWVCKSCIEDDEDWNAEKYRESPGLKDVFRAKP